ncbi:MAG: carbohydrate ABC transporter permease [Spirochaetes bacterium]|nr:carbohydrate ABC transporter permease [Spirochaetota bacterium]
MIALKNSTLSRKVNSYALLLIMTVIAAGMLIPFLLVIINAFKTPAEYAAAGPLSLPKSLYLGGIIEFWKRVSFEKSLLNSFVISFSVSVIALILSCLNAFVLGIGKIKGRAVLLVLFIIANTLPQEALAYPLYYMAKLFKIYDTQLVVILIFSVIQSAFGTYLLSSVYSRFPVEIIEAARVDGCSKFEMLIYIILPNSKASLSVLFTFFFIWTWNEFFLPLIMLVSKAKQTVPIAVSITQGQHNMDVTMASASAMLGIIPCIIFFVIFQRTLTRGVTAGSVK